jgi:hypothetical protein
MVLVGPLVISVFLIYNSKEYNFFSRKNAPNRNVFCLIYSCLIQFYVLWGGVGGKCKKKDCRCYRRCGNRSNSARSGGSGSLEVDSPFQIVAVEKESQTSGVHE